MQSITLLKFTAAWCGPCAKLAPILAQLQAEYPDVQVISIDVDQSPNLAQLYRVKTLPTLIAIRDGQEYNRLVGLTSAQHIKDALLETTVENA